MQGRLQRFRDLRNGFCAHTSYTARSRLAHDFGEPSHVRRPIFRFASEVLNECGMRAQAYLYKLNASPIKVTESVASQAGMQRLPLLILTGSPTGFHGLTSSTHATAVMVVGITRSLRLEISVLVVVVSLLVRTSMIRSLSVRLPRRVFFQYLFGRRVCRDWISQGAIGTTRPDLPELNIRRRHAVVGLQASCFRRLPICSLFEPLYASKLQLLFE